MKGSGPIFIVGSSRSGTALLRSILNNHKDVHVAGETHYFDDLRPRLAAPRSVLGEAARQTCEDYFLALAHRPYGHGGSPAQSPVDRQTLRDAAREIGEGSDAYFEAFCRLEGKEDGGKARWGEKTPRHVYRLPELFRTYPQAKVVCMVRDPRAVVASYRDWRNQGGFDLENDSGHRETLAREEARVQRSYNVVLATLLWRGTVTASNDALRRFGSERVRILRYEDLVREPETIVRGLVEWLGIDFDGALLNVPVHNSSVSQFSRRGGISQDPLQRWRKRLGPREMAVIEWWAGAVMRSAGYEPICRRPSAALLMWTAVSLSWAVLRASAANRARISSLPGYTWRRLRPALRGRSGG